MKLISFLIISGLTFIGGVLQVNSQDLHPILASFTLTRDGNSITANFGIIGGASCFGVDLERSTDSINFDVVAVIPGICGGTELTEFYTITDEAPVPNTVNLYRLNLGTEGKSSVISIFYLPLDKGISVFPVPAQQNMKILLDNPLKKKYSLQIINNLGYIIKTYQNQNLDEFLIDVSDFSTGTYLLRVTYENGPELSQKFMVY